MELPLYKVPAWLKILKELIDLYIEQTWNILQSRVTKNVNLYLIHEDKLLKIVWDTTAWKFSHMVLELSRSYKEYKRDWSEV